MTDGARVRAVYNYEGEGDSELSLKQGEIVTLLRTDESGWWQGKTADGREGYFPHSYVEAVAEDQAPKRPRSIQMHKDSSPIRSADGRPRTPPNPHVQDKSIGKMKTKIIRLLNRFLKTRPSREELQNRNIIPRDDTGETASTNGGGGGGSKGLARSASGSSLGRKRSASSAKRLTRFFGSNSGSGSPLASGGSIAAEAELAGADAAHAQPVYFGVSIADTLERQPSSAEGMVKNVPLIVTRTTQHLERDGLDMEGLFRISALKSEIHAMKAAFNRDGDAEMKQWRDPHVAACVLKLYLRELPEPLCTTAVFPDFIAAAELSEHSERLLAVQMCMGRIPAANRTTLRVISRFLATVASRRDENKMSVSNLALIFGPTLFSESAISLMNMSGQCKLVELLINHHDVAFLKPRRRDRIAAAAAAASCLVAAEGHTGAPGKPADTPAPTLASVTGSQASSQTSLAASRSGSSNGSGRQFLETSGGNRKIEAPTGFHKASQGEVMAALHHAANTRKHARSASDGGTSKDLAAGSGGGGGGGEEGRTLSRSASDVSAGSAGSASSVSSTKHRWGARMLGGSHSNKSMRSKGSNNSASSSKSGGSAGGKRSAGKPPMEIKHLGPSGVLINSNTSTHEGHTGAAAATGSGSGSGASSSSSRNHDAKASSSHQEAKSSKHGRPVHASSSGSAMSRGTKRATAPVGLGAALRQGATPAEDARTPDSGSVSGHQQPGSPAPAAPHSSSGGGSSSSKDAGAKRRPASMQVTGSVPTTTTAAARRPSKATDRVAAQTSSSAAQLRRSWVLSKAMAEVASTEDLDGVSLARALWSYQGASSSEISFKENDVIVVLSQDQSGWWEGRCHAQVGFFPGSYVEIVLDNPLDDSQAAQTLQTSSAPSSPAKATTMATAGGAVARPH